MTETRIKFLKNFNDYIINQIGDEDIIDYWLMCGVPDEADDEILRFIAENENSWVEVVETFAKCCKAAGVI